VEPVRFRRWGSAPQVSLLMSACSLPSPPEKMTLFLRRNTGRSATRRPLVFSVVSVVPFSPEYYRRPGAHSVRWYAIIIERLLPSPSPECLCPRTSLRTQGTLGDLNGRSGLFPSRHWTFAPSVCPDTHPSSAFGVFLDFVKVWAPVIQQVLYLREGSGSSLPT